MDDNKPPTQRTEPTKNPSRLLKVLLALAIVVIIGLMVGLGWCLWGRSPSPTTSLIPPPSASDEPDPCFDSKANDLPAGYSWYENAELGYKFAYPSAWGDVTVTTTPVGGDAGHYAQGNFAGNPDITFGGNATDYTVLARGGMPTDNPGYLEATGKFYAVQLWKLREGAGDADPQHRLHLIDAPTARKDACNTHAAVSQYPHTDFYGYSYDVARVNLQPGNLYYGVNFVLKNPSEASRADLDKIIRSFQLIP